MLHVIARGRMASVLGLISDINTDTRPASYEEVMRIHKIIEDGHQAIPFAMRWRPLSQSIIDSPNTLIQRLCLEVTYLKAKILLHRRALINRSSHIVTNQEAQSVQICLDAAVKILDYQQVIEEERQPDGRLFQARWKISHVLNHDILLATSILCLYLHMSDTPGLADVADRVAEVTRREEIRWRLTISHKIWLRLSATSAEAQKAARALSIVLGKPDGAATDPIATAAEDFFADFDAMPFDGYGALTPYSCEQYVLSRDKVKKLTMLLVRLRLWLSLATFIL